MGFGSDLLTLFLYLWEGGKEVRRIRQGSRAQFHTGQAALLKRSRKTKRCKIHTHLDSRPPQRNSYICTYHRIYHLWLLHGSGIFSIVVVGLALTVVGHHQLLNSYVLCAYTCTHTLTNMYMILLSIWSYVFCFK
jgi:hypothetical protein